MVPELVPLIQDNRFWDELSKWDWPNHVVLFDEIGSFDEPIPLRDWRQSKFSQNKESTLARVRNAKYVEDLYS